ncbi:MAG: hypothetical protein EZS28_008277 [Streblomastix strix]|uniref:RRM domain-containing protein n=1 Tax=Streblomastix strix TaxID=222440 RepID=A0A5J4WM87_9EUKA|nr:MAG: hypothetical protein EZS28_008277 [Streblomastix strix]
MNDNVNGKKQIQHQLKSSQQSSVNLKTNSVHITNIPVEVNTQQLSNFLSKFGKIKYIYYSPYIQGRARFADVEYETYEQAEAIANSSPNNRIFCGSVLQVRFDHNQLTERQKDFDEELQRRQDQLKGITEEELDEVERNEVMFKGFNLSVGRNDIIQFVTRFGVIKKFLILPVYQQKEGQQLTQNISVEYVDQEGKNQAIKADGQEFEGCKLKIEHWRQDSIQKDNCLQQLKTDYKFLIKNIEEVKDELERRIHPNDKSRIIGLEINKLKRNIDEQMLRLVFAEYQPQQIIIDVDLEDPRFSQHLTLIEFFTLMDKMKIDIQGGFVSEEVDDPESLFAIAYFKDMSKLQNAIDSIEGTQYGDKKLHCQPIFKEVPRQGGNNQQQVIGQCCELIY